MFSYPVFDVEIERNVIAAALGWPEPKEAETDSGLGGNRSYVDLRRLPWSEAKRVYAYEEELAVGGGSGGRGKRARQAPAIAKAALSEPTPFMFWRTHSSYELGPNQPAKLTAGARTSRPAAILAFAALRLSGIIPFPRKPSARAGGKPGIDFYF